MKDAFNREIEIGDIVVYGYNSWVPIFGIVNKLWPVWVQIAYFREGWAGIKKLSHTTAKRPDLIIIVNELYTSTFFKDKIIKLVESSGISINLSSKNSESIEEKEKPEV
jgi:hypothetical protein